MQHDFDELDPTTRQALKGYRVPPPAPFEQMWDAIEHTHFDVARSSPMARWRRQAPIWLAAAATLVLGIGIGRYTVNSDEQTSANPQVIAHTSQTATLPQSATMNSKPVLLDARLDAPYEVATHRYLDEAATLLAGLPTQSQSEKSNDAFGAQANDLLLTTRMLLDSPAAEDPGMRGLLSDLELVLAQVVHLQPERDGEQMMLVTEAMKQRDVLPRLENAVMRVSRDF